MQIDNAEGLHTRKGISSMALYFRKLRHNNVPEAKLRVTYTLDKDLLATAVLLVVLKDQVGVERVTAERAERVLRDELCDGGYDAILKAEEHFGQEEREIAQFRARQLWPAAFRT